MVSVLIIHYNTPSLLKRCLTSLFEQDQGISFQVLVVDNASPDTSVRSLVPIFPNIKFLFNCENLGFARACNQGIEISQAPYVLLLNPDTVLPPGGLKDLVDFMEGFPNTGMCGPKLVNSDGSLQYSCRRFPSVRTLILRITRLERVFTKARDAYLMVDWDHAGIREVDWVIGAAMMLRRDALDAIDAFDDNFFMYYEDLDLCYRLWQNGWKVCYNPNIAIVHDHRRMSAQLLPNRQSWIHIQSFLRLFSKLPLPWY